MRASPLADDKPALESHLARLEAQLRDFEATLRRHQESHARVRNIERDLAAIVERGASVVRDLAAIGDQVRGTAEAAARDAVAASAGRLQDFEQRATHVMDAYAHAVRAAQQAVARAEARIDAFDERVAQELAKAGRDVHEAATLLRDQATRDAHDTNASTPSRPRGHRLLPALLAIGVVLAGLAMYGWVARSLRDASARAAVAERHALDARREASHQIAAIERSAAQAGREAAETASRSRRMVDVLAAPDARRMPLFGQRRAPDASGQAIWSATRGAIITVTGLPLLPAAETYQVWLVTSRGSSSLGLMTPDARGSATAVFELPAGAGSIRGFMLSREPSGGRPLPSRAIVLAS